MSMDYSVEFKNLITDLAINPAIKLEQAQFIYNQGYGTVNPGNKVTYPEIKGIKIFCHLGRTPSEYRKIQQELETALYLAEEIFTALVAKSQCYCYLAKPITCVYNDKMYILEGGFWEEHEISTTIIRAGSAFMDDASFIDENKNFHPMYHFYRAAKDRTNSQDYRALNAWRFLEALHGIGGTALVKHLIEVEKQSPETINNFYDNIRCAVAHAKLLKNDPLTDKVILPKSIETQFDGSLIVDLSKILKYLDSLVAKLNPQITGIQR